MAINPETQYPGKIAPSTPDYPYGAARNITVPGDGTGTPWEAALVNDLLGFQQAMLTIASIVPTGSPDTATASQYVDALRRISGGRGGHVFPNVAAVATGSPTDGSGILYAVGQTLIVAGGNSFSLYSVVSGSGDIDLGGGLWAKKLDVDSDSLTKNIEATKEKLPQYGKFIDKPRMIAHQGGKNTAKTNTMLAFSTSMAHGFDDLELDVQVTSDGVLVVFHDSTVDAETDGTGTISSLTLAQVKALRFTSYQGTFLADVEIPTFDEVLDFAKANGAYLWAEIKEYRSAADVPLFLNAVVNKEMTDSVCFVSSIFTDVQTIRSLNSDIMVGQIFATYNDIALAQLATLGNVHVQINYTQMTADPSRAQVFRDLSVGVSTYTHTSTYTIRRTKSANVNQFISDISSGRLL